MPPTGLTRTIFDDASLRAAIESTFVGVPAGHKHALIGWWTVDGKWRVTTAHRFAGGWVVGATFGQDFAGAKISGGVYVKGSW